MPDTPEPSGQDLARLALTRYKEAAKTAPATRKKTIRRTRATRGDGRDPIGVGNLMKQLNVDQEWNVALEGASVQDRWTELCPQFAGHVDAVAFDDQHGCLVLRPGADGYAAHLRLMRSQLIDQINNKLGRKTVRQIRVLAVGPVSSVGIPQQEPESTPRPQLGPVRTRETASAGYRRTLQANLENRPSRDPSAAAKTQAAIDRQTRALAHPARREPETAFADAVAERERLTASQTLSRADAIRQAALHQKHTGGKTIQTAFQQTA